MHKASTAIDNRATLLLAALDQAYGDAIATDAADQFAPLVADDDHSPESDALLQVDVEDELWTTI